MIVLHIPSWFPHPQKPLDGNFILRQISTVSAHTTSIVLHHIDQSFREDCAKQMDPHIIFRPILTQEGTSKIQMIRAYSYEVEKIIRKYGKPDLIHLHVALPLGPLAVYLSKRHNIPLIISEHWSIYQAQNRGQLSWKQKWQLRQTYRQAKHLTTVSDNLHEAITATVPAARKVPYTLISNAIDTSIFHIGEATERSSAVKRILHVSTLDDKAKNILGILRTVKALHQKRSDFELDIIHDIRNDSVEQYIQENGLQEFVHLLGRKSETEVAQAILNCDFMLQFSNYENQPCVLLESFCCGKPVVATTVGGIPEIANQNNARLLTPRDEEMLLNEIDYMLDHFQEYDAALISQDGMQRYDQKVIGEKFMDLYRQIAH